MFKGIFASNLFNEFRIRNEFHRRQKKLYADTVNWTIKYNTGSFYFGIASLFTVPSYN